MMMQSIHKKAFTLIELLVVISIIALLLSIMMPALNKARQGENGCCRNNLKQVGLAMMVYAENNRDCHPRSPTR